MYRSPRGTADILPTDQKYWRFVEAKAAAVAQGHGYFRIDTPVFESSDLFLRTIGETSDIVQKEMYTFLDRGGDSLTLRPEGTAPVCRAYLEHGMHNLPQPVRLYYFCPVFRYERPQSGRFREHHQFGIEALGDNDPGVDAEVVVMAWELVQAVGLSNLSLLVNSIGDQECRPAYIQALSVYYRSRIQDLCRDCQHRYDRNPLRLLDCKQEMCQANIGEAPRSVDYLCSDCRDHWDQFQRYMSLLGLPYATDHRLVRGLDYYTRTVFEIQPVETGAQTTILGGGRYDKLMSELGGKDIPGVGFAAGLERLVLNLRLQGVEVPEEGHPPVFVTYRGGDAHDEAMRLVAKLQHEGVKALLAPAKKSLKSQMRHAAAMESAFVVILGDDELKQGKVTLRDMINGEQELISQDRLLIRLRGTA